MQNKINPVVGIVIVVIVIVLICVGLYKHNFKPTEGSINTLPPDEKAKIMGAYGSHPRPQGGRPQTPGTGTPPAPGPH